MNVLNALCTFMPVLALTSKKYSIPWASAYWSRNNTYYLHQIKFYHNKRQLVIHFLNHTHDYHHGLTQLLCAKLNYTEPKLNHTCPRASPQALYVFNKVLKIEYTLALPKSLLSIIFFLLPTREKLSKPFHVRTNTITGCIYDTPNN